MLAAVAVIINTERGCLRHGDSPETHWRDDDRLSMPSVWPELLALWSRRVHPKVLGLAPPHLTLVRVPLILVARGALWRSEQRGV